MSLSIARNHGLLGLSDELAALEFPDKDGRVDVQTECHVKLFPTSSLSSTRDSGFDELFWCRNRLLWSSHGRERVRIETSKHVVDATLCPMLEDDASVQVLCVAEQTLLTIYTVEGDIYHHTLPYPVKSLWSTPGALVVEHHGNKPAHVVQNCITGAERLKAITSSDASVPLESWESQTVHFLSAESPYALSCSGSVFHIWCLKSFPEGVLMSREPRESKSAFDAGRTFPRTASPHTAPAPPTRSKIRSPEGNIQRGIFSNFLSSGLPGTVSTVAPQQVYLPTVSVQLAFELVFSEELPAQTLQQVALIHSSDGNEMFALRNNAMQVLLYAIDGASRQVVRRSETLEGVAAMVALDFRSSLHQKGSSALKGQKSLLTLREGGQLWIHMGAEPLLQVSLPPEVPLDMVQLQTFPPPERPDASAHSKENIVPGNSVSDRVRRGEVSELSLSDLTPMDITHACGRSCLMHCSGGVNMFVTLDLHEHVELVFKCMQALQFLMEPPHFRTLLQGYYRCASPSGCEESGWAAFESFMVMFWSTEICAAADAAPDSGEGCTTPDHSATMETSFTPEDTWTRLLQLDEAQQLLSTRLYPAFASLVGRPAQRTARNRQNMGSVSIGGDRRNMMVGMLEALHSVFEDLKLDQVLWRHIPQLAALLSGLAGAVGLKSWKEYYTQHLQAASRLDKVKPWPAPIPEACMHPEPGPPPDIQAVLLAQVSDTHAVDPSTMHVPLLVQRRCAAVQRSIDVLRVFRTLHHALEEAASLSIQSGMHDAEVQKVQRQCSRDILSILGDLGWTLMDIDTLPFGIALPIHEALHLVRKDPPADQSAAKYILLGREDIAATMLCMADALQSKAGEQQGGQAPLALQDSMPSIDSTPISMLHTPQLRNLSMVTTGTGGSTPRSQKLGASSIAMWPCSVNGTPVQPVVGHNVSEQWSSRFVLGTISAQRLGLPGASVSGISAEQGLRAASADRGATEDPSLNDLSTPFYRMRFGRDLRLAEALNMLSFSRHVQLASVATPDATAALQAKLALHAARSLALPMGRGALTLSTVHLLPTEPLEAYKIVLDGRIPNKNNATIVFDMASCAPAPCGGATNELTAWPEFHAGVAVGLRVIPSSSNLIRYWLLFQKPSKPTYSRAGMLLALGLSGELKTLSSPNQYRYLCQEHTAIMVALLMGLAASHRGTMDAATSRTLHMHIPARHQSAFGEVEIAPLTQAAAMVGLGLLYEGTGHKDTSEMLLQEIVRRPASSQAGNAGGPNTGADVAAASINQDREAYALAAGFALGLINLGRGRWSSGVSNGSIAETLRRLILGGAWAPSWQPMALWQADQRPPKFPSDDSAPSHGLSQVVLEGSLVNLDVTSPAATLALTLMFLKTNERTVADMLVLPDTAFNLDFIRPSCILLRVVARSLIMWDSIEPTQEWVMQQMPEVVRTKWPNALRDIKAAVAEGREFDHEAVLLAHIHAVAGACLALGLRYAGTAVEEARATLQAMLLYILQCRKTLAEIKVAVPGFSIDAIVVERMAAVCAMALGAVMSGMGDLKTFKLLRALRKRLVVSDLPAAGASAASVHRGYGVHMAVGLSIGFLFLGGACYKFNTSSESVAMLLISMWPVLPSGPSDNRFHLQALRQLYVLACEKRIMRAIDVNIRQPVYVPVTLAMASEHCAAETQPLDVSRDENEPLNTPANVPPAYREKGLENGDSNLQVVPGEVMASMDPFPSAGFEGRSLGLDGLPTCGHTPAVPLATSHKQSLVTERLCPCLMPEPDLLQAVERVPQKAAELDLHFSSMQHLPQREYMRGQVGGSRYWSQKIQVRDHGQLLQALCDRAAVFVKKRAHALAYQDDPTGVRSLLSTLVSPNGVQGSSAPGANDLLHICATFSSDPVVMGFAMAFCQQKEQSQPGTLPQTAAMSDNFLWRLLSEGVMHETAHLLPMQLHAYYTFKALGTPAVSDISPTPPRFQFSTAAAAEPLDFSSSRPAVQEPQTFQPSSPMSEDGAAVRQAAVPRCRDLGWGGCTVASCAGLMQVLWSILIAEAYHASAPLTRPSLSSHGRVFDPSFLQCCNTQLDQLWDAMRIPERLGFGQDISVSGLSLNADHSEAERLWIGALAPVYALHKRAGSHTDQSPDVQELVSMLREALPPSDLACVLSAITGSPPELVQL